MKKISLGTYFSLAIISFVGGLLLDDWLGLGGWLFYGSALVSIAFLYGMIEEYGHKCEN